MTTSRVRIWTCLLALLANMSVAPLASSLPAEKHHQSAQIQLLELHGRLLHRSLDLRMNSALPRLQGIRKASALASHEDQCANNEDKLLNPLRGGGATRTGWLSSRLPRGKNRVPLSLKLLVLFCGGAWFSACLQGLFQIAKFAVVPGGLSFLSDRSSHGLPGVLLFVAFVGSLSLVQITKLVKVLQARGLEEIRNTLWVQAVFNVAFIWKCGWRPSTSLFDMQWRDAIILAEANAMLFYFLLYWSRKPWRGNGHSLK